MSAVIRLASSVTLACLLALAAAACSTSGGGTNVNKETQTDAVGQNQEG